MARERGASRESVRSIGDGISCRQNQLFALSGLRLAAIRLLQLGPLELETTNALAGQLLDLGLNEARVDDAVVGAALLVRGQIVFNDKNVIGSRGGGGGGGDGSDARCNG